MKMKLIKWFYSKRGFDYDPSKRLFSRVRSNCHDSPTSMKTMFGEKELKTPFAKLPSKQQKKVYYLTICSTCLTPCEGVWSFKHI